MGKVYMKAEDNDAGVTVEDDRTDHGLVRIGTRGSCLYVDAAEFRAVIEGGLRWMLENDCMRDPGLNDRVERLLHYLQDGRPWWEPGEANHDGQLPDDECVGGHRRKEKGR